MIGVYKITNPIGDVYIGSSTNIKRRYSQYKTCPNENQRLLFNSLCSYGFQNHSFEIIETCNKHNVRIKERYWQDYYDVIGDNGLNLFLEKTPEKPYVYSSKSLRGKSNGLITKQRKRFIENRFGKYSGENNHNSKLVLNTETGIYYTSCKDAALCTGINISSLRVMLSGHCKNRTQLAYV